MKNILIAIILLTFSLYVEGQYQTTTVKTPTGVTADAYKFTGTDFTPDEIVTQNHNWTVGYNCEIIANSTLYYNCHGYAWHNSEGNMAQANLRWINDRNTYPPYAHNQNVDKYYTGTNPAYKEITVYNRAGIKVSYDPSDHSAVTSSTYGYFISKWASGPLVKHLPAQCPFYNGAVIKYYELNPSMSGSTSLLCYNVERNYTTNITDMPTATITWTPNAYVIPVSGAGTPTYRVKGSSGNGTGTVSFQITTPSGFTSQIFSKSFWVGKPVITNQKVDGNNYYSGIQLCPGNHWLSVTPVGSGAGNATWTVPSGVPYFVGNNTLDFTFPSSFSSLAITANSANTCGTSTNANFYLTKKTSGCTYSYGMTVYPNPASDYVMVMIEVTQPLVENSDAVSVDLAPKNATTIEPATYTLSIYNSQSMLIYTVTRNNKNFTVPLGSVQDGTYVIKISDGDNCYQQQLIVKRR